MNNQIQQVQQIPDLTAATISTDQNAKIENAFYAAYAGREHTIPLILTAVLLNCVGIPGFFMNLSVVWVTFRHRALHGSAYFLLALTSLFEMGHEAGHLLFLWMALSGRNFLPYRLCFWFIAVPIFCIGGIFASMFSTGLDRLLSVLLPKVHTALPLPAYLALHCLFSAGVSMWLCLSFMRCAQLYPDYPVTGYVSDLIIGECGPVYTYSSFAFNLATILIYMVVGILIMIESKNMSQQTHGQTTHTSQRLFRSLAIIILANIGGYFYVSIMRAFIIPLLKLDPIADWYVNSYDGILLNVSSAINAPVLYFLSKDYRTAYDKELAKLPRIRIEMRGGGATVNAGDTMMVATTTNGRRQQLSHAFRNSSNAAKYY